MDNQVVSKVEALMKDEVFVKQLIDAETPEEAQKLFASRGIDFTLEEVQEIANGLNKMSDDELNDKDLENVAGGVAITTVATVAGIIYGTVKVIDTVGRWFKW